MKKLREKIEALGYDFKKEILIFCIGIAGFLAGFALIYIFSQRIIFALISLLFLIVFAFEPISNPLNTFVFDFFCIKINHYIASKFPQYDL